MGRICKLFNYLNAGQYSVCWLAFLFFGSSCQEKQVKLALEMQGNKATGIIIPGSFFNGSPQDVRLSVRLHGEGRRGGILGSFDYTDKTVFHPLVPLTPGLTYDIFVNQQRKGTITVPASAEAAPKILGVYPKADTLPANLLKIYLRFSAPMRQGNSLVNISVIDDDDNVVKGVFLDLQPELWDSSGTVLTLWLDPGRIKRGLNPNLKMGAPLKQGKNYTLMIGNNWSSYSNKRPDGNLFKKFVAGPRDDQSPDLSTWSLQVPQPDETYPLYIYTNEQLDHFLMKECVRIFNSSHQEFPVVVSETPDTKMWKVTPARPWPAGSYSLEADPKLEDLAGNNLERPFDRDLTKKYRKSVLRKIFVIK